MAELVLFPYLRSCYSENESTGDLVPREWGGEGTRLVEIALSLASSLPTASRLPLLLPLWPCGSLMQASVSVPPTPQGSTGSSSEFKAFDVGGWRSKGVSPSRRSGLTLRLPSLRLFSTHSDLCNDPEGRFRGPGALTISGKSLKRPLELWQCERRADVDRLPSFFPSLSPRSSRRKIYEKISSKYPYFEGSEAGWKVRPPSCFTFYEA